MSENNNLPEPTGKAHVRKKSMWDKVKSTFIATDVYSVADYILFEIVEPAVKETFYNMIQGSVGMFLFGDRGRGSGGARRRGGYVSYDRYYDDRDRDRDRRYREGRRSFGSSIDEVMNDLQFDDRETAEYRLNQMRDHFARYKVLSVKDAYDIARVSTDFTKDRYGWTRESDLRDARVIYTEGYYIIDINRPEVLRD